MPAQGRTEWQPGFPLLRANGHSPVGRAIRPAFPWVRGPRGPGQGLSCRTHTHPGCTRGVTAADLALGHDQVREGLGRRGRTLGAEASSAGSRGALPWDPGVSAAGETSGPLGCGALAELPDERAPVCVCVWRGQGASPAAAGVPGGRCGLGVNRPAPRARGAGVSTATRQPPAGPGPCLTGTHGSPA